MFRLHTVKTKKKSKVKRMFLGVNEMGQWAKALAKKPVTNLSAVPKSIMVGESLFPQVVI